MSRDPGIQERVDRNFTCWNARYFAGVVRC